MADVTKWPSSETDRCICGMTAAAHPEKKDPETGKVSFPCAVTICKCHQRTFTLADDQSVRPFTGDNPNS